MSAISGISASIQTNSLKTDKLGLGQYLSPIAGGRSFQQTLQQIKKVDNIQTTKQPFIDSYDKLLHFREAILSGKNFNPQQLISYQILASEIGVKVELLSKIAEGVMSTARKLQSNQ